jgi:hypothetical protein
VVADFVSLFCDRPAFALPATDFVSLFIFSRTLVSVSLSPLQSRFWGLPGYLAGIFSVNPLREKSAGL